MSQTIRWSTTVSQAAICWVLVAGAVLFVGCGADDPTSPGGGSDPFTYDAPWPEDIEAVLVTVFTDGEGDQEALPPSMAGTPYAAPVLFPSVDVTRVSLGVDGDYLYMKVEYAGPIPTGEVHIASSGEIEEQWVGNQGMNVAVNSDGDEQTGGGGEGVYGIDIFFALSFEFGVGPMAYANWGFPDGDVHHNQGQTPGEFGFGGPGTNFGIVRYDISELETYVPRGTTVDVGSWSEAESFDAQGELKYHHFAFDRVIDGGSWQIPE